MEDIICQHQYYTTMLIGKVAYRMSFTYPCPRKLREIMKMSLIEKETPDQIKQIWQEYHQHKISNTATVMDKHKYNFFGDRASSSPFFMVPVFRKGGHFKLVTQWQQDCFLCTFMEDYKRQGPNAAPYCVFTLFPQLLFQKTIVLVRGDIINNSLTKPEAEGVWNLLENSYTNETVFDLVHKFNNSPSDFSEEVYNDTFGINR